MSDRQLHERPGTSSIVADFYGTTVGKKAALAISGAVLFLFVVAHLAGNLQVFLGREKLNDYAASLRRFPELLWAVRAVLLAALLSHVVAAYRIVLLNRRARPVPHAVKRDVETNYAARTMAVSGPLVLLYVIYHLLMFTFLATGPGYSRTDVYANVVRAFQVPAISAVYIAAMLVLGTHLYHGVWSMLHTLGVSNPRYKRLRRFAAPAAAALVTGGYISLPLAVLAGLVT